jgi:type II secretory pathway pseudopilin PulG
MSVESTKIRFTLTELLIIVFTIGFVFTLLMPAVQAGRESARQEICIDNMRNIGVAFKKYYDANKHLPGSAELINSDSNKKVGGWSFLVRILPMIDQDKLYNSLSLDTIRNPLTSYEPNTITARNTLLSNFVCPENPNKLYQDEKKKITAFTNYKAMGATLMNSLLFCTNPSLKPPYGNASMHPDGALFPGKGLRYQDFKDGLANTFILVETIDDSDNPVGSSWLAGECCTLVGLPQTTVFQASPYGYFFAPKYFNGNYGDDADPNIKTLRTYLQYDFSPQGKDFGKYPDPPGPMVGNKVIYGPSSGHPNVVNHLMASGSARPISKDIDYALYFFTITRDNGKDPDINTYDWLKGED